MRRIGQTGVDHCKGDGPLPRGAYSGERSWPAQRQAIDWAFTTVLVTRFWGSKAISTCTIGGVQRESARGQSCRIGSSVTQYLCGRCHLPLRSNRIRGAPELAMNLWVLSQRSTASREVPGLMSLPTTSFQYCTRALSSPASITRTAAPATTMMLATSASM